jgi:radical SAM protein with 4Fe4S-binding SPASM domain
MTFEMFKSIVDEIEGKVDFITLASRGEPLLNKKLPEMLAYAKGKFLGLKINTNASHLTDEMSRIILDSGVSTVVFSADAGDKDVYESLRVNGNFDKVMSNISKFNQIRKLEFSNSKTLTRVSGVLFNPGKQDMDSHRAAWENLVDQVAFVNYLPWENPYDSKPSEVDEPCSDLWRRMFIWWDGKVNPCDVDYLSWLSVGNVKAHKISDLWNSEGYSSLRKSHNENMRKSITPCKSCFVK